MTLHLIVKGLSRNTERLNRFLNIAIMGGKRFADERFFVAPEPFWKCFLIADHRLQQVSRFRNASATRSANVPIRGHFRPAAVHEMSVCGRIDSGHIAIESFRRSRQEMCEKQQCRLVFLSAAG